MNRRIIWHHKRRSDWDTKTHKKNVGLQCFHCVHIIYSVQKPFTRAIAINFNSAWWRVSQHSYSTSPTKEAFHTSLTNPMGQRRKHKLKDRSIFLFKGMLSSIASYLTLQSHSHYQKGKILCRRKFNLLTITILVLSCKNTLRMKQNKKSTPVSGWISVK